MNLFKKVMSTFFFSENLFFFVDFWPKITNSKGDSRKTDEGLENPSMQILFLQFKYHILGIFSKSSKKINSMKIWVKPKSKGNFNMDCSSSKVSNFCFDFMSLFQSKQHHEIVWSLDINGIYLKTAWFHGK